MASSMMEAQTVRAPGQRQNGHGHTHTHLSRGAGLSFSACVRLGTPLLLGDRGVATGSSESSDRGTVRSGNHLRRLLPLYATCVRSSFDRTSEASQAISTKQERKAERKEGDKRPSRAQKPWGSDPKQPRSEAKPTQHSGPRTWPPRHGGVAEAIPSQPTPINEIATQPATKRACRKAKSASEPPAEQNSIERQTHKHESGKAIERLMLRPQRKMRAVLPARANQSSS